MHRDSILNRFNASKGLVPTRLEFRRHKSVVGISCIVLFKGAVGGIAGRFQITHESVANLVPTVRRLDLCLDSRRNRSGLDHAEKRFFNGIVNPQPAKRDATRLAIVKETSPARITRNVVLRTGVIHRQLAAAAPAS
jgi:hypothetical protein